MIYNYFNDCPIVPKHLSHKISQANWDWINEKSRQLCDKQEVIVVAKRWEIWEVRGYFLITYFMNPTQDNLDFMVQWLKAYKLLNNNLEYLEFVAELKQHVKGC